MTSLFNTPIAMGVVLPVHSFEQPFPFLFGFLVRFVLLFVSFLALLAQLEASFTDIVVDVDDLLVDVRQARVQLLVVV